MDRMGTHKNEMVLKARKHNHKASFMLKCQYYLSIKTAYFMHVCKNGLIVVLAHFMIIRVTNIHFFKIKK